MSEHMYERCGSSIPALGQCALEEDHDGVHVLPDGQRFDTSDPNQKPTISERATAAEAQLEAVTKQRDELRASIDRIFADASRLEAQRDGLVELLREAPLLCDGSHDGDNDPPCVNCRISYFLDIHGLRALQAIDAESKGG